MEYKATLSGGHRALASVKFEETEHAQGNPSFRLVYSFMLPWPFRNGLDHRRSHRALVESRCFNTFNVTPVLIIVKH